MPVDWRVEPLQRDHDRSRFDCGEPELDDYLARFARQNHESGVTRTFVAVRAAEPTRILGYYSLAVDSIDKKNLSPQIARRFPNFPLPIARLARLAVDRELQGEGRFALPEGIVVDPHVVGVAQRNGIVFGIPSPQGAVGGRPGREAVEGVLEGEVADVMLVTLTVEEPRMSSQTPRRRAFLPSPTRVVLEPTRIRTRACCAFREAIRAASIGPLGGTRPQTAGS